MWIEVIKWSILVRIWRRRRPWIYKSIDCATISCERRYFQLERYRECSVGASFEFSHERISGWTCCVWDVRWPHLPPSPLSPCRFSPLDVPSSSLPHSSWHGYVKSSLLQPPIELVPVCLSDRMFPIHV